MNQIHMSSFELCYVYVNRSLNHNRNMEIGVHVYRSFSSLEIIEFT